MSTETISTEIVNETPDLSLMERADSAPDADKVKAYAKAIAAIPVPELKTEAGKTLAKEIATTATKFANWLNSKAEELTK